MHLRLDSAQALVGEIAQATATCRAQWGVAPVGLHLASLCDAGAFLGVQDLSDQRDDGACTGEISAQMAADAGAQFAIIGHSERRQRHGESSDRVALKAQAALDAGLLPVVCVGESLVERQRGQELAVVRAQLAPVLSMIGAGRLAEIVIAYEPVWAIGTGETASPEQAQAMHAAIRAELATVSEEAAQQVRLLYGGSMKPGNAQALLSQIDIDGGLVGGASLNAADFAAIVAAAS